MREFGRRVDETIRDEKEHVRHNGLKGERGRKESSQGVWPWLKINLS